MAVETTCPACGTPLTSADEMLGRAVRCSCGHPFVVGETPASTAPAPSPAAAPPTAVAQARSVVRTIFNVLAILGLLSMCCCGSSGLLVVYLMQSTFTDVAQGDTKTRDTAKTTPRDTRTTVPARPATAPETSRATEPKKPVATEPEKPPEPPKPPVIASIDTALTALKEPMAARRLEAVRWLAKAPLDFDRQPEVAAALESFAEAQPDDAALALDGLATWAARDSLPALRKLADNAAVRTSPAHFEKLLDLLASYRDDSLIPLFVRELYGPNGEWARAALVPFGLRAEKELLPLFNDPVPGTRTRARTLLLDAGIATDKVYERVLADLGETRRLNVRHALDWLDDATPEPARSATDTAAHEPLLGTGGSNTSGRSPLITQVAKVYVRWAGPENVRGLVRIIEHHELTDSAPRYRAMELAVRSSDPRSLDAVVGRVYLSQDREAATRVLLTVGAPAEQALRRLIRDVPTSPGRAAWIEALSAFPGQERADIAMAVEDVKSGVGARQHQGFMRLAQRAPDEGFRAEVVRLAFEGLKGSATNHIPYWSRRVLQVWARTEDVPALLDVVRSGDADSRPAALHALRRLKDGRTVGPLTELLKTDPKEAYAIADVLIAVGPAAEKDALPLLKSDHPRVRQLGCRVLGEVGSAERAVARLEALAKEATAAKDHVLAAAAQYAIMRIRERK